MLSHSTLFDQYANGAMRPLSWKLLAAFDKQFNSSIQFFTIGVSTIGGPDIIKGDSNVLQDWDRYTYTDYSNRVLSIEITRQEESVSSTTLAMADIELDNHDGMFTGGNYELPKRPMKLYLGFGDENLPQFVGLTDSVPSSGQNAKTVKYHLIDFMSSLFNRPLDQAVLLTNQRTDQVLDYLLQFIGLSPAQYVLDVGFNFIPFVYFDKGTTFGDAVKQLMGAEMGRFFMDETGIIRFKNRQNYSSASVATFDGFNTIQVVPKQQSDIVNVVEVTANERAVFGSQQIWQLNQSILIPAGATQDVWPNFSDPVTSCNPPLSNTVATDSFYTANTASDGSGDIVSLSLVSTTLFSASYKMTFYNPGATDAYITQLQLFGTPARVTNPIAIRQQDSTSVSKYDEQTLKIENDFIQTAALATSRALILLQDQSEYGNIRELTVKGNPATQVSDPVILNLPDVSGSFVITKIVRKLLGPQLVDTITVKQFTRQTYFTIGVSTIGGPDVIAP